MPFDGISSIETDQLAKLGAVERLLATEQQWCKGRLRDAHGRHCLVGAIEAVEGRQMLQRVVLHAAREVSGKRYWRIEFFNDDPRTTHADVLEVLHHARDDIIAGIICERDRRPLHQRWMRSLRALYSRPGCDAGGALRSAENGTGFFAVPYGELEADEYPDSHPQKDRAVVMEMQH